MSELIWTRKPGGRHVAIGANGTTYEVRPEPYGKTGKTWTAYADGERIPLSFSSRLKDSKRWAQTGEARRCRA